MCMPRQDGPGGQSHLTRRPITGKPQASRRRSPAQLPQISRKPVDRQLSRYIITTASRPRDLVSLGHLVRVALLSLLYLPRVLLHYSVPRTAFAEVAESSALSDPSRHITSHLRKLALPVSTTLPLTPAGSPIVDPIPTGECLVRKLSTQA